MFICAGFQSNEASDEDTLPDTLSTALRGPVDK